MKLSLAYVVTAIGVMSAPPSIVAAAELAADTVLTDLVRDALANRPELVQAEALVKAEKARVPQARALPDPTLSLGIQNDGFKSLRIGETETSYWSIVGAQTLPWFGKRGLRAKAQSLGARQTEADLERTRLSIRGEVERGYLDLLLVRDQSRILGKLETLWKHAEGLARTRYEAGQGAQSDLLRAQLERSRLQQQRLALGAEEGRRLALLDRLAGRPLGQPIVTALSLGDVVDPSLPDSAGALADAEARTPELRRAKLAVDQWEALISAARKDYFPDLTLSGGIMPRGGAFEPMWQAGVSLPIPLWAGSKQSRAVGEYRLRGQAAESGAETIRRLVRQRLTERRGVLGALLETNRLYRSGLLIQSDATVSSAMAQYQVGRVPFASVLEALNGYLTDQLGFFESVATTQRLDIAQRELSLDPVAGPAIGGLSESSMPGNGGTGGMPAAGRSTPPTPAPSTSPAMPRM